jgi:hypothetical protein
MTWPHTSHSTDRMIRLDFDGDARTLATHPSIATRLLAQSGACVAAQEYRRGVTGTRILRLPAGMEAACTGSHDTVPQRLWLSTVKQKRC